jgi:queuine tRNA-ribosyltransferase
LRHLVVAKEITGLRLTTLHNLHFVLETMRRIRQSILDGGFADYRAEFLAGYETRDA